MGRLSRPDLRSLLGFLREIYALTDCEAFAQHVISALPKVVGSEITSFNEVDLRRQRLRWRLHPHSAGDLPGGREAFERHMPEHPLIERYRRTRDGRALKISDFLTRSQFHRLGLYNEFYRRLSVEHQMALALPTPHPLVIGIALNRSRPDFSETERALLDLLRPHLVQAWKNAEAFTEARLDLALLGQVMDAEPRAVLALARDGRPRSLTPLAWPLFARYFGERWRGSPLLPKELRRWVADQHARLAVRDDVPCPLAPLVVERGARRLVARLLPGADQDILLLEEQHARPDPRILESLGLTPREAEVLAWVAEGKTNAEISTILGARIGTVKKHIEHIHRKLGVETRTAAVRVALTYRGPGAGGITC